MFCGKALARYTDGVRLAPTPRPPRLTRSGLILSLYSGLALVAIGWAAWSGRAAALVVPGLGAERMLLGFAAGVAAAAVMVFAWRWATHRLEWARMLEREFRDVLGPLSPSEIFILAAASSLGEELFFRGALLPAVGLWGSSLLFALPHIGPGARFLPWTATSLLVGLGLGALAIWSGSLAGPVAAHFFINLLNLRRITRPR